MRIWGEGGGSYRSRAIQNWQYQSVHVGEGKVLSGIGSMQADSLTEEAWNRLLEGPDPQGSSSCQGQIFIGSNNHSCVSCQPVLWKTSDHKLDLQLIIEEGEIVLRNFCLQQQKGLYHLDISNLGRQNFQIQLTFMTGHIQTYSTF